MVSRQVCLKGEARRFLKPAPPRTVIGFRHLIVNGAEKTRCAVHHWQLDPQLPTTVRGGAESLKGFHSMGVERKDENLCASLPLRKAF